VKTAQQQKVEVKKNCVLIAKLDGIQLLSCLVLLYLIGRFLIVWTLLTQTLFALQKMIGNLHLLFVRN
jgi:hypothetical protein